MTIHLGENNTLRNVLFDGSGLRLEEWLANGRASVVKRTSHRAVYRVVLPEVDCFVKQYPIPDVRAWLRQLVRPSKARVEYTTSLAVQERGVATIEPLAFAEEQRGGASCLVTRTLPNVVPLNDYIELELPNYSREEQTQLRQRLATTLGRFLATMHGAGVVHRDLHPGNLLVRFEESKPLLYLIDLHDVTLTEPLAWPQCLDNLVILNRWFSLRSERTDRARFWKAYRETRPEVVPRDGCPPSEIERATLASNLQYWLQHDKNCLLQSRHYRKIRTAAVIGHAVSDLDADWLASLADNPDAPFEQPNVRMLKDGDTSTVIEIDMPSADGMRSVIYKKFLVKSWRDPWTALLRPPAALRCFVFGHGLRHRGLPTPRPLCALHRRKRGLLYEGYLLQEKVPAPRDLHEYLDALDAFAVAERRTKLHSMLGQLGRLLATLHQRGLSHRDLKAGNLLVTPQQWRLPRRDGQTPVNVGTPVQDCVWFVDLVGVRQARKIHWSRRVQNVARLHASFANDSRITRSDKLRFLRMYLGQDFRAEWKGWWNAIERATRKKIERNRRTGRPLS